MKDAEFNADFVRELKEILLSTSQAEIYGPPGTPLERVEEPFLAGWHMRSIGFDPSRGRSRVNCRLDAGGKEVTATIDAADFPEVRAKRTRSRAWNNSQYHNAAVLVSFLIQEQILTRSPDDLDAGQVRICLPADRSQARK